MKGISPEDILCLNDFEKTHPLKVDVVYADGNHPENIFKTNIYRVDAKMWGHKDLVDIILRAASICHDKKNWRFVLKDCLRTTDAQQKMLATDIVRAHPQWIEEPNRLLSPPGKGGHPRGMAVDIDLIDDKGSPINMGTVFDHLAEDHRVNNPAARSYTQFSDNVALNKDIADNRRFLEECMIAAAQAFTRPLLPLPQEWWDFRFPADYSNQFAPLADADLPPKMRMVTV